MQEKPLKKAISLIFREGDKVRVFKRSLNKEAYPGAWSLPSTYVHKDEDATKAANRLVKRKLGIPSVNLLEVPIGESPVVDKDTYFLYMTDYLVESYSGEIVFDIDEYTEERLVTPEELLELINNENNGEMGECTKTFLKSEDII